MSLLSYSSRISARLLAVAFIVVAPLLAGSAPSSPMFRPNRVMEFLYVDSYNLIQNFAGFEEFNEVTGAANSTGEPDDLYLHYHREGYDGSFAWEGYFEEGPSGFTYAPAGSTVHLYLEGTRPHESTEPDHWYILHPDESFDVCDAIDDDCVSTDDVLGVHVPFASGLFEENAVEVDIDTAVVYWDCETCPTPTPTPTRTATTVPTHYPTSVVNCFATSTLAPTGVTPTATFFGATRTPTRTATPGGPTATPTRTATPFPTGTAFGPVIGLGVLYDFSSSVGTGWIGEGGWLWDGSIGHNGAGSMRVSVSLEFDHDTALPRLLWPYPVSEDWVLEGYAMIDSSDDIGALPTVQLRTYDDVNEWVEAAVSENILQISYPLEDGEWKFFRVWSGEDGAAAAIVGLDLSPFTTGNLYIDELRWQSRHGSPPGGGGLGACMTATPQPLETINAIPDCDDNMCVGLTHVPGTPPCVGYDAFTVDIPAIPTYTIDGVQVCFDRYELGEVRVGSYDFEWAVYVALFGIPIIITLWMVLRARA